MEVEITSENFAEYKNGELPLLLDFWAEWCGPCKMISPIVSQLAEEYDGKIVVGKCNVEDNEDLAVDYKVMSVPTLLIFKKGQDMPARHAGPITKAKITEFIEANL